MIKLLIIDDESDIREGIKCSIDWDKNDILIIGEASNGVEALDVINKTFPDLILVDIRMPLMNGLQLIESLSSTHPYIKAIIVSGYDDFSYAKKALSLGAIDYLLKPCGPDEILEAVLKAKVSIEKYRKETELINKYKIDSFENHQFIRNKYLVSLLNEKIIHADPLMDKFDFIDLEISKNNFTLMIIRFDNYYDLIEKSAVQDIEMMKYAAINISQEILRSQYICEVFEYKDDIIALINTDKTTELQAALMEKLKSEIRNCLKTTVSIGISDHCDQINKLHNSYKEAINAVEHKFFTGENSTIYYNHIKNSYLDNKSYPINLEKQVINTIESGSKEEIEKNFNAFFKTIIEKDTNKKHLLKVCRTFLFSIYHFVVENNGDGNEIMKEIDELSEATRCSTIDQLNSEVYKIVLLAYEKLNHNKIGNKFVQNAMDYINDNYDKNIDLETVAKNIYISPSYVSSLFKQVLGINFVDYLHKFRLKKACSLLKDNKLKAYEVAYMVGYNDDKYFSQIFKKYLGLTPSQYRDSII
jgi:Response regulator containing CheY-like receiver domain and AraC-type DNA-binding domain